MQLSDQGLTFLEAHEGVVLKAYRDPVGVWTIGAGLTSASGVVKVTPGMIITRKEASRLLSVALARNYEPAVAKAMPGAKQHEFDAGVSFHWNTGAIGKATWVKRWRAKAGAALIRAGLMSWVKGGGKVLPGLKRRREEEADILLEAHYAIPQPTVPRRNDPNRKAAGLASFGLAVTIEEVARIREGFRKLGCDPGQDINGVSMAATIRFQADHDLKADGVIGRATLSTLQRALDARGKAKPTVAVGAVAGGVSAADPSDLASLEAMPWLPDAVAIAAVAYGLWLAWSYRDQIAAAVQTKLPRVAAFLRSF